MRRRELVWGLAAGCAAVGSRVATAQVNRPALVAVAASVQGAMAEIAGPWARETGRRLNISYGSSGNLARQIQQGLPAE